ncbi:MAG: DUF4468 domain-containing protein [Bacteroidales bacterium]
MIKLTFLLSILGITAFAQTPSSKFPIDEETGLISYKEVVEEEGTKQEFFNRAIGWVNEFYTNPVDVTKTRDPQTGLIKGIHRFKIKNTDEEGNETDAGVIQYNFTLELKEGRYRYTLTEFVLRQASKIPVEKWLDKKDPQYNPSWNSYLKQVEEFAESWIASLKEGMMPKVEKSDDDW